MNYRLVILLTLMVAAPLAVLGWLGVRLQAAERAALGAAFDDSMNKRFAGDLRGHAQTIAGVVDGIERETLATLNSAPVDPPGLRALLQQSPYVTQFFVVDDKGAFRFPSTEDDATPAEQEFLARTHDIWSNGELTTQAPPEGPERSSLRAAGRAAGKGGVRNIEPSERQSGWYVWHWGSDIHLLLWSRRPEGAIVGAEINRARLIAEIIVALPDSPLYEVSLPATRTELRNSRNDVIYAQGPGNSASAAELRVTLPLDYPLNAWSLAYFVNGAELHQTTQYEISFWYRISTQLGAVAIALVVLAAYLYRENARTMREASQRVTFVNQVSHELKTPLTNIRMYAEMLEENLDHADEQSKRHVGVLVSESQRLSRMIGNILTFSRKERRALKLRPTPGTVDACVCAVLDHFRPVLEARGIVVTANLRAEKPALIDADAVEQIVGNLVGNVEKYAAAGKQLHIATAQSGDTVTIAVSDAGPGIPPKERARVFEAFYRVSNKLTDGVAGTGIGLTIARELARLHGGDLTLQSSEQGAHFVVVLRCPRTGGTS